MKFAFDVVKLTIWARKCSCLDCLTVCYINWTYRTHRKMTVKLCQNRVEWSFRFLLHRRNCHTFCRIQKKLTEKLPIYVPQSLIFCLTESLPDTMVLKDERGCPNITEELWVTVQTAKYLCNFQSFGSCLQCSFCLLRK